MKKKGFTLIELLVVIAIIAMLLAILMPALNKVKRLAQRLVCATNLKGMGTALAVYSNDDKYDQYPDQTHRGGVTHDWHYSTAAWGDPAKDWTNIDSLTVSASLFLLVREADVDPKSFVCKSSDQKAYEAIPPDVDLVEIWDFGSDTYKETGPQNCVSYAFQNPFQVNSALPARPANSSGSASMAIMADRNPYWDEDSIKTTAADDNNYMTVADLLHTNDIPDTEFKWRVQAANSLAHNREGQNVLFNDGHSEFVKRPDVGIANDNIYTPYTGSADGPWTEDQRRQGGPKDPQFTSGAIRDNRDNYLVNEYEKN